MCSHTKSLAMCTEVNVKKLLSHEVQDPREISFLVARAKVGLTARKREGGGRVVLPNTADGGLGRR